MRKWMGLLDGGRSDHHARLWKLVCCCLVFQISHILGDTANRQLLSLRGVHKEEGVGKPSSWQHHNSTVDTTYSRLATPAANVTLPLHAHSGTHHVHMYIGSPPQRQTLIVDTGSRMMAFPCKPCRSCGKHASPYFDPSRSSTIRVSRCGNCLLEGIATCSLFGDQCEITQKYTEGSSWAAHEVEDMVWLGTPNVMESIEEYMQMAVPYAFGCQTSINGLFRKQYADGILGLARHESSMVAAYYHAGVIPRSAFSLCLTLDAGHLSLGGSMPTEHHLEPMHTTPITREHGWYSIRITKVLVGDIVVVSEEIHLSVLENINGGKGCILDSGTTDTYLPSSLSKKFGKAAMIWSEGVTDFSESGRQRKYTFQDFQRLPEITFEMTNGVVLTMYPKNYMEGVPLDTIDGVQEWAGYKFLTNRVYMDEPQGAVLGANAMIGYDILFDSQSHQIGIAKADCAASIHSAIL